MAAAGACGGSRPELATTRHAWRGSTRSTSASPPGPAIAQERRRCRPPAGRRVSSGDGAARPPRRSASPESRSDEVEHPVGGIEHIANPTRFSRTRPLHRAAPVWVPTPDGSSPSGSDSTTPSWTVSPKPVPSPRARRSVSGVKQAVDQRIDEGLPGLDDVLAHLDRGPLTGAVGRVEQNRVIAPVPLPVSNTHLEVGEAMRSSAG